MKKESLKSRITAEGFYNEFWQLREEKESLVNQLKKVNEKLRIIQQMFSRQEQNNIKQRSVDASIENLQ